jgi:hypothetical protein
MAIAAACRHYWRVSAVRDKFEAVVADARDAVSRAVKTVQRHFVRRRYKEHASNEASANENYSKKADGDCFK